MKNWIFCLLLLTFFSGCAHKNPPEKIVQVKKINKRRLPPLQEDVAAIYPRPLKNNRKDLIVIDAGHGGEDAGTRSLIPPKYQEKSLNLATARVLKGFLEKMGYMVRMTRNDDTFVSLPTRSLLANNYNPKLFISVHYNAAESELAEGIEVYYYKSDENKTRSASSKKLADLVLEKLIQKTGAKSRGVKHGNLAVIRETEMPAILVEGGFMTNKNEMEKIKDPVYIKQLAYAIALGVDQYIKKM
jgi:N-acetylmuramoyl-L-alanine amidase